MKTITIEVPASTPVIQIIKALAAMGLRVKWRSHNLVVGVDPAHCATCKDSGFYNRGGISHICNCRKPNGGNAA